MSYRERCSPGKYEWFGFEGDWRRASGRRERRSAPQRTYAIIREGDLRLPYGPPVICTDYSGATSPMGGDGSRTIISGQDADSTAWRHRGTCASSDGYGAG